MPPPAQAKRPFTTSSLTSTLRSTIASQPILGNTFDKLSSQANSLAQKSSIFGALNQQFQQASQSSPQHNHAASQRDVSPAQGLNPVSSGQQHYPSTQPVPASKPVASNESAAGKQEAMTTPTVDMSHLTEEERLMIQSVMAKAEMADMGMPVDTSMPSSTNLPSQTSQALTQQRNQQQQLQHQRQLQQQQQQQQQHQQQQQQQQQQTSRPFDQQNNFINVHNQQQQNFADPRTFASQQNNQQQSMSLPNNQFSGPSNQQFQNQSTMLSNQMLDYNCSSTNKMAIPGDLSMSILQQQQQPQQNHCGVENSYLAQQSQKQQPAQLFNQGLQTFSQQPMSIQQGNQQNSQNMQSSLTNQENLRGLSNTVQPQESSQITSVLDQFMPQIPMNPQTQIQQATSQSQAQQQLLSNQTPGGYDQMIIQNQQIQPQTSQQTRQPYQIQQTSVAQVQLPDPSFSQNHNALSSMNEQLILDCNKQQIFAQAQPVFTEQGFGQQYDRPQAQQRQPQLQQQTQPKYPTIQVDAEYERAYSDHELQGSSSRRRGLRAKNDPTNGTYIGQDHIPDERVLDHRGQFRQASSDLQAYDLAGRQPSPQTYQRGHKVRRLPAQPSNFNVGLGALNATPQSSNEYIHTVGYNSPMGVASSNRAAQQVGRTASDKQQIRRTVSTSSRKSDRLVSQKSCTSSNRISSVQSRKRVSERQRDESITDSELEDLDIDEEEHENEVPDEEDEASVAIDNLDRPRNKVQRLRKQSSTSGKKTTERALSNREAIEQGGEFDAGKGSTKEIEPKDKAIQLLSELKLSEQANQVMEQQQLLIKQSQELIKLQQAQLEQRDESKRALKKSISHDTPTELIMSDENVKAKAQSNDPQSKKDVELQSASNIPHASITTDKTSQSVSQTEAIIQKATATAATMTTSEDIHENKRSRDSVEQGDEYANSKKTQQQSHQFESSTKNEIKRSTNASTYTDYDFLESKLCNTGLCTRQQRDLLHSPTDTTDSDIDLSASRRRAQRAKQQQEQLAGNRSRGIVRRREPMGLPPSPLPVAAAIQLHQLQQQHIKNANNHSTSNANLHLRSRSVTSSPNHLLERVALSGYMTDSQQRTRPSSPDTMSEYGGNRFRRRRRLPEPPTNAVPLTPSMVRKMIQAQKSAAASSNKLLTSVNAQSTLLTNMHSTRNPSFDRPPEGMVPFKQTSWRDIDSATVPWQQHRVAPKVSFSQTIQQPSTQMGLPLEKSLIANHERPTSATAIHKDLVGLTDRYRSEEDEYMRSRLSAKNLDKHAPDISYKDRSLLINPAVISDVKETPELDKLISNLDEYYDLNSHQKRAQFRSSLASPQTRSCDLTSFHMTGSLSPRYDRTRNLINSSGLLERDTGLVSAHLSKPSYRFNAIAAADASSLMMRRSSESESTPARLSSMHPYNSACDPLQIDKATEASLVPDLHSISGNHHGQVQKWPQTSTHFRSGCFLTGNSMSKSDAIFESGLSSSSASRRLAEVSRSGYPSHMFNPTENRLQAYPTVFEKTKSLYSATQSHHATGLSIASSNPFAPSHTSSTTSYPRPFPGQIAAVPISVETQPVYGLLDQSTGLYQDRMNSMPNQFNDGPFVDRSHQLAGALHNRNTNQSLTGKETSKPSQSSYNQRFNQTSLPLSSSPYSLGPTSITNRRDYSGQTTSNAYVSESIRYDQYGSGRTSRFAPLTKDDIINHGPKFNSIGYRYGTENQNKYVSDQQKIANECLQSRYPHPYKKILLSKDPKDRIGNGIGVQITGGQPLPNLWDKVNNCILSSGAFVKAVFQSSSSLGTNELGEGDQIIEWNGVNLCNRSDEEVQQILLSQFSDEEVEIIYLNQKGFLDAYDVDIHSIKQASFIASPGHNSKSYSRRTNVDSLNREVDEDLFDQYSKMNRSRHDVRARTPRQLAEPLRDSLRRKLSLSSISHKWMR